MTDAQIAMLATAIRIHGENLTHAINTHEPTAHPGTAWVRDGLESIASAIDRHADKTAELASATASIADAISNHGEAVSAAIDIHSESIDRLADAVETRAP